MPTKVAARVSNAQALAEAKNKMPKNPIINTIAVMIRVLSIIFNFKHYWEVKYYRVI
jgi:hypothetical protein